MTNIAVNVVSIDSIENMPIYNIIVLVVVREYINYQQTMGVLIYYTQFSIVYIVCH